MECCIGEGRIEKDSRRAVLSDKHVGLQAAAANIFPIFSAFIVQEGFIY